MEENKFKTGQEVLVRDNDYNKWSYSLFSHYTDNVKYPFATINGALSTQCISYKGNKHLVGTTDSPKEDLPIDTPVMVSDIGKKDLIWWFPAYYARNKEVWMSAEKSKTRSITKRWKYIIRADKFDFNNPENSLKYNIVDNHD